MTKRKPLSPETKAAARARLHDAMRKACEQMEQRLRREEGAVLTLTGVLAALDEQPREA